MAIRWKWNDKMGEVIYKDGTKTNLYQGNAYMICIQEHPNETYTLEWFAAGKEHLKNMLGLTKGYNNIIEDWGIKTIRLNLKYKTAPEIASLLIKAGLEIEIITYKENTENEENDNENA